MPEVQEVQETVLPRRVEVRAAEVKIVYDEALELFRGGPFFKLEIDGKEISAVRRLTLVVEVGEAARIEIDKYITVAK